MEFVPVVLSLKMVPLAPMELLVPLAPVEIGGVLDAHGDGALGAQPWSWCLIAYPLVELVLISAYAIDALDACL